MDTTAIIVASIAAMPGLITSLCALMALKRHSKRSAEVTQVLSGHGNGISVLRRQVSELEQEVDRLRKKIEGLREIITEKEFSMRELVAENLELRRKLDKIKTS